MWQSVNVNNSSEVNEGSIMQRAAQHTLRRISFRAMYNKSWIVCLPVSGFSFVVVVVVTL